MPCLSRLLKSTDRAMRSMKYIVVLLLLACAILLGSKVLINILDEFGFGPNIQNQNERIEENLRRLERSNEI
jgi:hypothetical protein